jgi:multiple antibiotic resistance protein
VVARDAFVLLVAAMLVGSYVLAFFGISLPVVRVAGGLDAWQREVGRRSFYPLTFPLTVGPGSISIAVTLGARDEARLLAGHVLADVVSIAAWRSPCSGVASSASSSRPDS